MTTADPTIQKAAIERPGGRWRQPSVLPGFGIAFGFTLTYLGLIVLIPLVGLALRPVELGFDGFFKEVTEPRVLAALRLSFGAALVAASVNVVFGLILAWVLVRYEFPMKRVIDAFVDLPFALPTAIAGITLTALFAPNGWFGSVLEPLGVKVAFAPLGVVVALIFMSLPFIVRTVEPVLQDLEAELEEAAASLGAARWQAVFYVILPSLLPAILTGYALAFAKSVGEYGSIIFISGNLPLVSEIAPLIIVNKLEAFDYAGASAVAMVMLVFSFSMLFVINWLQRWSRKRGT